MTKEEAKGVVVQLAETLSIEINTFVEKQNLKGDLAIKLNESAIKRGKEPLSSKEKAWASSFNQKTPSLDNLVGPKILKFLAIYYEQRFTKTTRKRKYQS